MGDLFKCHQDALLLQLLDDELVGIKHKLAPDKFRSFISEAASFINRTYSRQAIPLSCIEVIETMTAGSMDASGTVFIRDMLTQDHRAVLRKNNMMICNILKFTALEGTKNALILQLEFSEQFVSHGFQEDQFALLRLNLRIGEIRVQ